MCVGKFLWPQAKERCQERWKYCYGFHCLGTMPCAKWALIIKLYCRCLCSSPFHFQFVAGWLAELTFQVKLLGVMSAPQVVSGITQLILITFNWCDFLRALIKSHTGNPFAFKQFLLVAVILNHLLRLSKKYLAVKRVLQQRKVWTHTYMQCNLSENKIIISVLSFWFTRYLKIMKT